MKEITEEMKKALLAPIPAEAISQHPTKTYLSTIKAIYITERLNDVFGVGSWQIKTDFVERVEKMVVVKTILTIPEYGIYYECFGGNDNVDLGDAYKGATTDAITKIGSYLGIAIDVFKGKQTQNSQPQPLKQENRPQYNKGIDFNLIDSCETIEELTKFYNDALPHMKTEKQKEALTKKCTYRKNWINNHGNIIPSNPNLEYND